MASDTKDLVSSTYWEKRYKRGGNSGAGSRGALANYKTGFLNWTIERLGISSIIDFGCGDGEQIRSLATKNYTGIDVSPHIVEACKAAYKRRKNWHFFTPEEKPSYQGTYDAALSIDVIFHLVEDDVFHNYMRELFSYAEKAVIIYSSDWNAVGPAPHVRHRWFSGWVAKHAPEWDLVEQHLNPYPYRLDDPMNTSFANFVIFRPS